MSKDTDFQRRHGLGYSSLAAADASDSAAFAQEDVRKNLEAMVKVLTEENGRLLCENEALKKAIKHLVPKL